MKLTIPDYFYGTELEAERYSHYFRTQAEDLSGIYTTEKYKENEPCKYEKKPRSHWRNRKLSGLEIEQILELSENGMSVSSISTAFNTMPKRVNRLIEQIKTPTMNKSQAQKEKQELQARIAELDAIINKPDITPEQRMKGFIEGGQIAFLDKWPNEMVVIHELKTWTTYFDALLNGEKTFELRKNDRNFKVGDFIRCNEYDHKKKKCTGRFASYKITYVLKDAEKFGLLDGFCILGIK